MIETVLLWLFAGTALAAAALMLVLRHPMRVAVALAATMLALAGVYALLGVHAIAIFQVLIYVGAVMVFMVYAIMLLDVRDRSFTRRFSWLVIPGVAAALAFLAIVAHALWQGMPEPAAATPDATFGIQRFSIEFLNEYWLHF
jgi:NADH-quinone oxidoreductase subunit J